MNMKKIVASAAALSLTAAVAVGGTLAFLKDNTEALTNNFTYNAASQNVDLKIYERKIDPEKKTEVYKDAEGQKVSYVDKEQAGSDKFVYEGEDQAYTIIPGATVEKDPTLRLTSGDTEVYLYAEVKETNTEGILTVTMADGWLPLEVDGANDGTVYVWKGAGEVAEKIATGMTGDVANTLEYPVLESVTYEDVRDDVNATNIAVYGYVVDAVAGADAAAVYTATFAA